MSEGQTALAVGAVVAGMIFAAVNVGGSRAAWFIFGFILGRRKAKRR